MPARHYHGRAAGRHGHRRAVARLATLNPLAKLRYSATHKVVKNLLFRLTPFDAYRMGW